MTSFNILDSTLSIHQSTLLEASAGTGKTFTIENLVVRLLLEEDPLPIEKILAVTFTRAAARDLKERIRENLHACLRGVIARLGGGKAPLPPYLDEYKEENRLKFARRSLEHALFCFDRAQVFTIHGFCNRILKEHLFEADFCPERSSLEDPMPKTEMLKALRDYFRSEIRKPRYAASEIEQVLSHFGKTMEKLEKNLLNIVSQGIEIVKVEDFSFYEKQFLKLVEREGLTGELLEEEIISKSLNYNGIRSRSKEIKSEILKWIKEGVKAVDDKNFEALIVPFGELREKFHEKNISKNKEKLEQDSPLYTLFKLTDPYIPYCRMAFGIRELFKKRGEIEESIGCDDLIAKTLQSLSHLPFLKSVQNRYRAVVIDEFQDTDPLQWEIFSRLFLNNSNHLLYLVGDPKQSIYAFRQADIYTYRNASLYVPRHGTLSTNFRSQRSLVNGLNAIFSSAKDLFPLPKQESALDYLAVNHSDKISAKRLSESGANLHFWDCPEDKSLEVIENSYIFPKICEVIERVGAPFDQYAVLVADKNQAERMGAYFQSRLIPYISERNHKLSECAAYSALKEFLRGVLDLEDHSTLKKALACEIVGWGQKELLLLEDLSFFEEIILKFQSLRKVLIEKGFAKFYQKLLHFEFLSNGVTVQQRLLSVVEGDHFFHDLQQIAEILWDSGLGPEALLILLDDFPILELDEDVRLKKRDQSDEDAVHIQTIHSSKGLEFDIVFPIGLIKRPPPAHSNRLIPVERNGNRVLYPSDWETGAYRLYLQELDAEKMRQFYVAMTRAKYQIYCPVWGKGSAGEGISSAMELFLQKCPLKEVAENCPDVSLELLCETNTNQFAQRELKQLELIKPVEMNFSFQKKVVTSFSRMNQSSNASRLSLEDAPHDFNSYLKTAHTLPAGSQTGTLIHELLESIPFHLKSVEEVSAFIEPHLENTLFAEWKKVIAQMIFDALSVSLEGFCLRDVNTERIVRETTFMFPREPDFVKGVMDLTFEHLGKYYLLDWKTNWLGTDDSYYSQSSMKEAMQREGYFFQAEIYKNALKKWLKFFDPRPFDELYGGMFYLFLRGGKQGIFLVDKK